MKDIYVGQLVSSNYLEHYGKGHDDNPPGRGSGRYPWGSGKNPKQTKYDRSIKGLIDLTQKLPPKFYKRFSNIKDAIIHLDRLNYLAKATAVALINPSWYISSTGLLTIPGVVLNAKLGADTVNAVLRWRSVIKRKEKEPTDETGLHLKTYPSTPEQDCKDTNPLFGSLITQNTHNCALSTIAYDMRRRGYDVTAKPSYQGMSIDNIKKCYKNASWWHFPNEENMSKDEYVRDVLDWFNDPSKNGQRGNMCFDWDYPLISGVVGGTHSISYEVEDGMLVIRDAQVGKTIKDPYKYLKHVKNVWYLRTDNKKLNIEKIKECCE